MKFHSTFKFFNNSTWAQINGHNWFQYHSFVWYNGTCIFVSRTPRNLTREYMKKTGGVNPPLQKGVLATS